MYQPDDTVLHKYADLLIKFALNGGEGARKGEVVQINIPDVAKPLYKELLRAVLEAGALPKLNFLPSETDAIFFKYASDEQLTFFPYDFKKAEAELIDHQVSIIAEADPTELKDVEPARLFKTMDSRRQLRDWLFTKEQHGKFTWTIRGLLKQPIPISLSVLIVLVMKCLYLRQKMA
jgi:aminopeptidase